MSRDELSHGTPFVAAPVGAQLGEGPLWDHRDGLLWFVDILGHAVWRHGPGGATRSCLVGEPVGFVALTAEPGRLVVGLRSGLAILDWATCALSRIGSPEPDMPGNRINDGIAGPDGSVWFGTMDYDVKAPTGRFWRWKAGVFTAFGHAMACTNGPAFSRDGQRLYCVDTMDRTIHAARISGDAIGPLEPFFRFPDASWGYPDGVIVDAQDHLWVGHWAGGRLTRIRPDGVVDRVIAVPAVNITKCAFGGEELSTLFITSAADGVPAGVDVNAGHLLCVQTSFRGVRAAIADV